MEKGERERERFPQFSVFQDQSLDGLPTNEGGTSFEKRGVKPINSQETGNQSPDPNHGHTKPTFRIVDIGLA
jgi:hypothetical protein